MTSAHLHSTPAGLTLEQADRLWQQMQDELAGLSANSTRTVVPESGHFIHLDQPDAVVVAIRWAVEMAQRVEPGMLQ